MNLVELSKSEYNAEKLAETIKYVSAIKKAKVDDTDDIVTITIDQLRDDIVCPSLTIAEIKQNAPEFHDGYFVVSKVVD